MFIFKRELTVHYVKYFQNILYLHTKTFQIYFGNPSYHKLSITRLSKSIIYLLNWEFRTKRIVLLFLSLKLSISK